MKRFSFDDCVDQGLLRRITPSASAAESIVKASEDAAARARRRRRLC